MVIKIGKSGNPRCPFEVRWSEAGKLRRKRFKSKGDAALFAAEMQKELFLPADYQLTPDERVIFKSIKDVCAQLRLPLAEICPLLRQYAPARAAGGCEWSTAYNAYIQDLYKRGARNASVRFYKSQIGLFQRRENPADIADITPTRAEHYLALIQSPEHAKRALRAFYAFCVGQKWVVVNPFANAKTPRSLKEHKNADILTVAQTRQLLDSLPEQWRPVAAIMAFAGVRPAEIISIDGAPIIKIADVDFAGRKITVPAEVSKVRRARVLTDLPDNLWAWLEPLKNRPTAHTVAPASYDVWRRAKAQSGVELPKDVLRHSFASYGYHYLGAEHTVEILGHVGGFGVFAKHYKGLANADDAKKYFTILP